MPRQRRRLPVQKTYKLFIPGNVARGENDRVIAARDGHGNVLANYSRASRKDFRDAVRAARSAIPGWTKYSPYLRGQILYRAAEMLEGRRLELENELARVGRSGAGARREVTAAIDRLVYDAGCTRLARVGVCYCPNHRYRQQRHRARIDRECARPVYLFRNHRDE